MSKEYNDKTFTEDFEGFALSKRRRAREAALVILYQVSFGSNEEQAVEYTLNSLNLSQDSAAFARQLVQNARALEKVSDKFIAAHSRDWDFDRLFNIDVAILRLALSELSSSTPFNIVINEAVELAKKFGDNASPAFVNAVLDAVNQKT
ncbi:MAG: transcription antitermination factor NusB [Firmicutes bacterium]|nr:transcription antitermination factor NusB [Bacillota bacterium]